ncbi:MAG: chemotaxis protein CheW [Gammaproteobacteria bacterium]|nr:chemotaxis protein CheW [Gammaproteobacteria bacterium]
MLYLRFTLDNEEYAFNTSNVVEITPLVDLKPVPNGEDFVVGIMNYRGSPIPVIDLSRIILGREFLRNMSTRIIINNIGNGKMIGVIVEHIEGMIKKSESDFVNPNTTSNTASYLGNIAIDHETMIQTIDIDEMLKNKMPALSNIQGMAGI